MVVTGGERKRPSHREPCLARRRQRLSRQSEGTLCEGFWKQHRSQVNSLLSTAPNSVPGKRLSSLAIAAAPASGDACTRAYDS